MRHLLLSMTFILLLSACAVGPDYVKPTVSVPNQFKEAHGKTIIGKKRKIIAQEKPYKDWKIAEPRDDFNRGAWWKIFHDAKLNELEVRLNSSNQTIKQAYQNYLQACALVDEARASFFPSLLGSLNFTRQKQSISSATSGALGTNRTSIGSASSISDSYTWLLNASWEPDIWGSVRRTVEASLAGAQANAALLGVTRLSAQASLAQFYFELRGLDTDQKLLASTVREYTKILRYTQHRYRSGVDSNADMIQAKSQLETAQAASINNGVLRAQYEHAIAVLIGLPPAQFALSFSPLTANPPPIPLQLPSTLLERRPDIAQAERLAAQANAQIGVAVAAYYPVLTLSGDASTVTKKLFSVPALSWALGAQLADTLLDGGLRSATVRAAEAGYQSNVALYRQTVLAAFQDVEDNLASLRILGNQAIYQDQAAASAKAALKLIINEYKAGTVDYSSVYTAQIAAYTAEKAARDLAYLRMTAAVGLIKALGGGWESTLA